MIRSTLKALLLVLTLTASLGAARLNPEAHWSTVSFASALYSA